MDMTDTKDMPNTEKPIHRKRPEHYQLVNAYDSTVRMSVREVMGNMDMCKCERCFADICAKTLNVLEPRYVTTAMDEIYDRVAMSDLEKQMRLSDEVFNAIEIVKNNPSHK